MILDRSLYQFLEFTITRTQTEQINLAGEIGHEIRSPLTIIRGYLEKMRVGDGGGEILDSLILEVDRVERMTGAYIQLHLLDTNTVSFIPQAVELASLLRSMTSLMMGIAEGKNCQLNIECAEFPIVWTDPDKLRQILLNLLDNAIAYTPSGGKIGVTVLLDCERRLLWFSVCDSGVGISQADLPFIFNHGWRSEQAEKIRPNSGIGLTVTKRLVEAQGGSISVESELGVGATVTFSIPIKACSEPVPDSALSGVA